MYTSLLFLPRGRFLGERILDLPQDPGPSQAIGQRDRADHAGLTLEREKERKTIVIRLWQNESHKGKVGDGGLMSHGSDWRGSAEFQERQEREDIRAVTLDVKY